MDLKIIVDGSAGNEISSRITPLETLNRCIDLSQNTNYMYGFILQSEVQYNGLQRQKAFVGNNLMLDHKPNLLNDVDYDDVEIVASSMQGILCCITGNKFREPIKDRNGNVIDPEEERLFYVCKPITGQCQRIPWPTLSLSDARVGFMILSIKPLRYKIILISINSRDYTRCRCEVFDSNTFTWKAKWKEMEHVCVPSNNSESRLFYEQGVQAGRFLYFITDTHILAFHGIGDKEKDTITFQIPFPPQSISIRDDRNITTGTWTGSHLHRAQLPDLVRRKVIEYQGKLGMICMTTRTSSVQLWILEDEESQIWKKIMEVDLSFVGGNMCNAYPVGFYNADILVLEETKNIGENSLILCNIQDSTFMEITLKSFRYAPNTFPFRSDQETIVDLIRGCGILDVLVAIFMIVPIICLFIILFLSDYYC